MQDHSKGDGIHTIKAHVGKALQQQIVRWQQQTSVKNQCQRQQGQLCRRWRVRTR